MLRATKKDGSGFMTGNNVTEVHKMGPEFVTEVGVKRELPKVTSSAVESAFSRNAPTIDRDDIPW